MNWDLLKRIIFCLGIVALVITIGVPVYGAKWEDTPSGLDLVITSVFFNFESTPKIIIINGYNFDNGYKPVLTLGGVPINVISYSAVQILAELPAVTPDGDYRLTVTTGTAVKNYDAYALTIGAMGPAGPQGITTAVHGRMDQNGGRISGANWKTRIQQDTGIYMLYYILLMTMTDSGKPPTCVVNMEPEWIMQDMYGGKSSYYPQYNSTAGAWELLIFATRFYNNGWHSMKTGFSFICVQE